MDEADIPLPTPTNEIEAGMLRMMLAVTANLSTSRQVKDVKGEISTLKKAWRSLTNIGSATSTTWKSG